MGNKVSNTVENATTRSQRKQVFIENQNQMKSNIFSAVTSTINQTHESIPSPSAFQRQSVTNEQTHESVPSSSAFQRPPDQSIPSTILTVTNEQALKLASRTIELIDRGDEPFVKDDLIAILSALDPPNSSIYLGNSSKWTIAEYRRYIRSIIYDLNRLKTNVMSSTVQTVPEIDIHSVQHIVQSPIYEVETTLQKYHQIQPPVREIYSKDSQASLSDPRTQNFKSKTLLSQNLSMVPRTQNSSMTNGSLLSKLA